MQCYVLKENSDGVNYNLVLRSHDLGGTDYDVACKVSLEHALMLNRLHDIDFLYGHPYDK